MLHDWPDDECRAILLNLKSAMKPRYSKLLLNESVLPDIDYPSFFATGDIKMISVLGGEKRTELKWTEPIKSVGLSLKKIWKSPFDNDEEGVVEAMLKD